jgi:hypothetical protein
VTPYLQDADFTLFHGDALDVPCACGCGEMHSGRDSRGRPKRFVRRGHNLRERDNYMCRPGAINPFAGRTHSAKTRAVLSAKASVQKPWIRGERNGMHGKVGSLNPRYVDGSSPERQRAYASAEWREVQRVVRNRDGYRCVRCGTAKLGRRSLHLHHVKPWAGNPELRFAPDNIVTLCADCHRAAHRKEVCHQ